MADMKVTSDTARILGAFSHAYTDVAACFDRNHIESVSVAKDGTVTITKVEEAKPTKPAKESK